MFSLTRAGPAKLVINFTWPNISGLSIVDDKFSSTEPGFYMVLLEFSPCEWMGDIYIGYPYHISSPNDSLNLCKLTPLWLKRGVWGAHPQLS